jgi:OmpA-OmpF porin, OOP family
MALKLKTGPKIILAVILVAAILGGLKSAADKGYGSRIMASFVPKAITLKEADKLTSNVNVAELALPTSDPAGSGTKIKLMAWEWNAQFPLMYANGGPVTTKGSLMAKNGVNLTIERQDDNDQMKNALIKFAKNLKSGKVEEGDVQFISVMGDGAPTAFLAPLDKELSRLGKEYRPVIVGSTGYSRGEDKFMGPKEWRDTPYKAKGGVIIGVIRDGDWNIAMKWAADNGIKNNPDEKSYDPEALNWINAKDIPDGVEKYVTGYSEERPVVKGGKKTGEKKSITGQALVTWTPGDVKAFERKPGMVSIADTNKYKWQMAETLITIKKFADDNPKAVEGMLKAVFEGADQVKTSAKARAFASKVSQLVYKDEDAAYWEKYYNGVEATDKVTGEKIMLGGSSSNNLADNLQLFGLLPGQDEKSSIYRSVYTVFGDTAVAQYPGDVPSYPKYDDVVDLRFLKAVAAASKVDATTAERPKYDKGGDIKNVVSKRSWSINFQTGSANFTPDAKRTLEELYNQLNVTTLSIEVHGHTDNVGNADGNKSLSEKRAFAVKQFLQGRSSDSFPDERFAKMVAHGQDNPVAPNDSSSGKAKNRRVEIVLGEK